MWTLLSTGLVVVLFLYGVMFQSTPVERQWTLDNTCPVKKVYVRYPDGMHEASCRPTGIVWEHHSSK